MILFLILSALILFASWQFMITRRRRVPAGSVVSDPLSGSEMAALWSLYLSPWVASIVAILWHPNDSIGVSTLPVMFAVGFICWYGWRKKLPTKAGQVGRTGLRVLGTLLLVLLIVGFIGFRAAFGE